MFVNKLKSLNKYFNIKSLIFFKIFIIIISYFLFNSYFNRNNFSEPEVIVYILNELLFVNLVVYRKRYYSDGYFNLKWDKYYTVTTIIVLMIVLFFLQLFNFKIHDLENNKVENTFSGSVVNGDSENYWYNDDGYAILRSKSFETARYAPETAWFLFLENKDKKRIGFIACSLLLKENCSNFWEKIPKNEVVKISYQKIDGIDYYIGGENLLILTGLESSRISISKLQLIQKYYNELFYYKLFIFLVILMNFILYFWNKYLYTSSCEV